ncbi:type I restriction enzyme HsdR N-terminal domain-containing protein [Erwinia sp. MMLR14_017]|nr:type I restriction endonuclease [Erwinia sp. MMLR14_017]MDW8847654.1 type I restriction enzyme HsdR N-terminal domain-containing protein [Erwinia sp. MMLR14_017]
MEILDTLNSLSEKIKQQASLIKTEEATKSAFVMPFINKVLGYDVFDPTEVIPEFICDVGTKKGEKIDFAIIKNEQIQILIECKKIGEPLNINHASQLFRYFHVTTARISILTNGQVYKFFTDLDAPNKMDEKPFLELDLDNIDENVVPEIFKLTKSAFDVDSIVNAAGELKYVSQIKKIISSQFISPDDDFVKLIASRVYEGVQTQKVRELFSVLTKKSLTQWLTDQVNERLKSAINSTKVIDTKTGFEPIKDDEALLISDENNDIVTTPEEIEGYHIVKSIIRTTLSPERIGYRDNKSYFGILIDDNNRKPICRLHLNRSQMYIGLFDDNKKEIRHPLICIDDIFNFSEGLLKAAKLYL